MAFLVNGRCVWAVGLSMAGSRHKSVCLRSLCSLLRWSLAPGRSAVLSVCSQPPVSPNETMPVATALPLESLRLSRALGLQSGLVNNRVAVGGRMGCGCPYHSASIVRAGSQTPRRFTLRGEVQTLITFKQREAFIILTASV